MNLNLIYRGSICYRVLIRSPFLKHDQIESVEIVREKSERPRPAPRVLEDIFPTMHVHLSYRHLILTLKLAAEDSVKSRRFSETWG